MLIAVLMALLALALLVRPAHSAWSAEPVQVHATTALCPLVAASGDAHAGAIVAWQENTPAGGLLRARHLLAGGDLDPAWSAPAALSTMDIARTALGMVADGTGGAYVWWMENAQLYLTRVSPTGGIAAGWPARGRSLGVLYASRLRPSVAGDGSGGIYVAWLAGNITDPLSSIVRATHLGPTNTTVGGWPSGGRVLGTTPEVTELVQALGIDAAPDGGLWVGFATTTYDGETFAPGDVRVARYTAAGLPAAGWDARGVAVAPFGGEAFVNTLEWRTVPGMSLVAVANDGGAGAFVVHGDPTDSGAGYVFPSYRLSRLDAVGAAAPGWTPEGMPFDATPGSVTDRDAGADASSRAVSDGQGGVSAGAPGFFSEGLSMFGFRRFSGTGTVLDGGLSSSLRTDLLGLEYADRGDGGMVQASYFPSGPTSAWSPVAHVSAAQSAPGEGFVEWHDTPVVTWYGDVGLTATGDGGAIFAWSQVYERYGVFAVRLNPAGPVTAVPPLVMNGPPSLRLRFVPGVGVRALLASVPSGREELTLHDTAGRQVSSTSIESAAGGDWVFPDTERLPSGLYFARAVSGSVRLHARVAVVR